MPSMGFQGVASFHLWIRAYWCFHWLFSMGFQGVASFLLASAFFVGCYYWGVGAEKAHDFRHE